MITNCPACQTALEHSDIFCPECGTKIHSPDAENVVTKTATRGWNPVLACHICEACFAQDVKDAPACYKCGARFLTPEELNVASHQAINTQAASPTSALLNSKSKWLALVFMCLGIVVLCAIIAGRNQPKRDKVSRQAPAAESSIIARTEQSPRYNPPQSVTSVQRVICPDCQGSGVCPQCNPANPMVAALLMGNGARGRLRAGLCRACGGTGKGHNPNQFGILPDCTICRASGRCTICGGSGRCQTCEGRGQITAAEAATIQQYRREMEIQNQQIDREAQQHYEWIHIN